MSIRAVVAQWPKSGFSGGGILMLCTVLASPLWGQDASALNGQYYRSRVVTRLPHSKLAPAYSDENIAEPAPDTSLADAIAGAYRGNPTLQADRYDLRAIDENLGIAESELRPTSQLEVNSEYDKTIAGRTTQATRFGATSSIITSNSLGARVIVSQPLYTGGKATADISAASAEIRAGRANLVAAEGDLLLQTISAYLDVRRDTRSLAIRKADLAQMLATLDEVHARRDAGELTKTDIAQTETQIDNAEAQFNLTTTQLEQSRANYAALVGVDPGNLAPEPPLPELPATIDEAFDIAQQRNPELAKARFTEAASREKIAAARAASRPSVALQGTVGLSGDAAPFHLYNDDQALTVRGVLTIPLTNGGRVGAAVAQAEDTNSGDRLRIEAARRAVVLDVANAWNQMVTAERNRQVEEAQVRSAQTFYEGSFEEYRAGLRSTFDVLYAQETLLNAKLAAVAARHDLYVAQATLLRHIGLLEVRSLATGIGLYDPTADVRHIEHRGSMPWDPLVRSLDRIDKAKPKTRAIEQPPALADMARIAPTVAHAVPNIYVTSSPNVPQPGTVGRPVNEGPR